MSAATGSVSGSCGCGRVRYEVDLPSRFCAHCHCQNCRRAHGAAFVTFAGFPWKQFRFTDGEDHVQRFRSDTEAERWFCPTCGSTLFYTGPRWPEEIHVVAANLEGELDRQPDAHVYVDHKADWFTITDDLPQFGGPTGTEPKPG